MQSLFQNTLIIGFLLSNGLWMAQFKNEALKNYEPPKTITYQFEASNKKYKDKPATLLDEKTKTLHAVWTQFDDYKNKNKNSHSVIYYTKSIDEGKTWNHPKQLNKIPGDCLDGDSTLKGPMICMGNKSELFVTWAGPGGIAFQRSIDGGETWLKEEKIIESIKNGWSCKVNGVKTNGLPQLACDRSGGEFNGRLYCCWSDEKNGENNKDVFLIYSDDGGENWTERILVTYYPNHKDQFSPLMQIDPTNGRLCILYFDKQNSYAGTTSDLYLAESRNGGLKFEYYRVNESPFSYNSNYHSLEFRDQNITIIWMQHEKEKRFVCFRTLVNDSSMFAYAANDSTKQLLINRSFPYTQKMEIEFEINNNSYVTAVLTKPLEPKFEKIIFENKRFYAGKNKLSIDTKALNLPKDNYILCLYYSWRNSFVWITSE